MKLLALFAVFGFYVYYLLQLTIVYGLLQNVLARFTLVWFPVERDLMSFENEVFLLDYVNDFKSGLRITCASYFNGYKVAETHTMVILSERKTK